MKTEKTITPFNGYIAVIILLVTHVTQYFSYYAALGVDKLSSSLCAAFKAA